MAQMKWVKANERKPESVKTVLVAFSGETEYIFGEDTFEVSYVDAFSTGAYFSDTDEWNVDAVPEDMKVTVSWRANIPELPNAIPKDCTPSPGGNGSDAETSERAEEG